MGHWKKNKGQKQVGSNQPFRGKHRLGKETGRRERIARAEQDFREAKDIAANHGMELIQHTPMHFKLRTPWGLAELYPTTGTICWHEEHPGVPRWVPLSNPPELYLPHGKIWGLRDVVLAAVDAWEGREDDPKFHVEQHTAAVGSFSDYL